MALFAKLKKNKILATKLTVNHEEQVALLWATVVLLLVSLAVIWDVIRPGSSGSYQQKEPFFSINNINKNIGCVIELANASKGTTWRSFGDLFSSDAHLDNSRSDMFLDDRMTALIFPPIYSWDKEQSCDDALCGLSGDNLINLKSQEEESGTQILASLPRPLPKEVVGQKISFVGLNQLDSKQVVTFIIAEGQEERGLVYFLEADKYEPIINASSKSKILTKYGRGGGRISVAGDDDNFIIVYIGYEGRAFHYRDDALYDISRFFGLRVADNGFYPQVFKQGKGNETTWYVVSLSAGRLKFIKLWQNGTKDIRGAYDLSDDFATWLGSQRTVLQAFVYESEGGPAFVGRDASGYGLWKFNDQGFDNSKKRQVHSVNINSKDLFIRQAYVRSLGVGLEGETDTGYEKDFSRAKATIFLGDSLENFLPVFPGQAVNFSGTSREFYWKMEFEPGREKGYSPWFDNLNDLQYLLAPKDV